MEINTAPKIKLAFDLVKSRLGELLKTVLEFEDQLKEFADFMEAQKAGKDAKKAAPVFVGSLPYDSNLFTSEQLYEIGRCVFRMRRAKKMDQKTLARTSGFVSYSTISNVELGVPVSPQKFAETIFAVGFDPSRILESGYMEKAILEYLDSSPRPRKRNRKPRRPRIAEAAPKSDQEGQPDLLKPGA